MPRTSPVGMTYTKASQFPLSLRAKACALHHVEHMHMTRTARRWLIGSCRCPTLAWATTRWIAGLLPIPPHWYSRLAISTRVLGIRSKGHTPRAALLQETCALIEERYSGHLHLYTDSSVKRHSSAAASSIYSVLRDERKYRLPFPASSTTAELTALNLADNQQAELLPPSAVVFTDSRAVLLTLAKNENGHSIAQCLTRKFTVIVRSGCAVSFQFVPSHVEVRGHEAADTLAEHAHDSSTPATNFVHSYGCGAADYRRPCQGSSPGPPKQQPAILSHACRQQELVGVLVVSCCAFELDAAEPRTNSSDRVEVAALLVCSAR
ncbi:hypothetical protein MRX96_027994 [Rhipicephalus microplus]